MSIEDCITLDAHLSLFSELQSDIVGEVFWDEGSIPLATYLLRDKSFKVGPLPEPFPKYMLFKEQGEVYEVQDDNTEVRIGDELTRNGIHVLLLTNPRVYRQIIAKGLLSVESPEDPGKGTFMTSYDIERVGEEVLWMPITAAGLQSNVYGREWSTVFRLTDKTLELGVIESYNPLGISTVKYTLPE